MKPLEYTTILNVNWQKADNSNDTILTDTGQDVLKRRYIKVASQWITRHTNGRNFVPVQKSKSYHSNAVAGIARSGYYVNELQLDDDLLSVITLTNGDSSSTAIAADKYELLPLNSYPKHAIENVYGQNFNWQFANRSSKVVVNGFWGYHNDYDSAWQDTDALTDSIDDDPDTTTIPVGSGSQFTIGEYLLIGTEIMQIESIDSNNLTVTRAANDTTIASHDSAATVYKYQQVPDIELACHLLVNWFIDNRTAVESRIEFAMDIPLTLENKIPGTIWDIIYTYRKPNFQASAGWFS